MLEKLFSFGHGHGFALSFTQLDFWLFFLLVLVVFSLTHQKKMMKTIFFTAIGLFFYFKTSGASVLILSFSIILNYLSANRIFKTESVNGKKAIMIFTVSLNVLILAYFKYAFFFTESFNAMFHTDFKALNYFAQWTSGVIEIFLVGIFFKFINFLKIEQLFGRFFIF